MDEERSPSITSSNYSRSENITELAKALPKAQAKIQAATKDSENPHFRSRYADLASIWAACQSPLTENGFSVIQPVSSVDGSYVTVTTMLLHSSGEWVSCSLTLKPAQATPQGMGSCITYGRRYSLASMVGVVAEDDDGEAASRTASEPRFQVASRPPVVRSESRPEPSAPQTVMPDKGAYLNDREEFKAIWQRLSTDLGIPAQARATISQEYLSGFHSGNVPKDAGPNIAALKALDKAFTESPDLVRDKIVRDARALGEFIAKKADLEKREAGAA